MYLFVAENITARYYNIAIQVKYQWAMGEFAIPYWVGKIITTTNLQVPKKFSSIE